MSLTDRLVEVIADLGDSSGQRYRYGSGVVVCGRTVLTAAHVIAGAERVIVRDRAKRVLAASVDPRFVGDPEGPDLALFEVENEALNLPPIGLARVDRDSATAEPVRDCHAVGYPSFAETNSAEGPSAGLAMRETVDAIGVVPVLSKLVGGLLSVLVSVSPRPMPPERVRLGESEWSGMSGAPVLAGGLLLGVVTEQAPREGPSALTAIPLTALEPDCTRRGSRPGVPDPAAWWSRLGVSGVEELTRLPVVPARAEPVYWDTLREYWLALHNRMPQLLGRERELDEIAAFATGDCGYRWLVGGAYAGKTALLVEAVMTGLPLEVDAQVDVISYFLSRRVSDADSNRFLEVVVPQLAYLCAVDPPPAASRDTFYALWRLAVERAQEQERHLLLVVDGLDEDLRPSGSPSVASQLPALVGDSAHVLVASRPQPELPGDVPLGHPLRQVTPVSLAPFEGAEVLLELAEQEIDTLMRGDDGILAVEVLGLLAAAAGPLSVEDLAQLSRQTRGSTVAHAFQLDRFVSERAGRSLEPTGQGAPPRYRFAHDKLLEHARRHQYLAHTEFGQRLHRWAEQWRERGWSTGDDSATTTPRYLLDTYPAALSGDPDSLAALVSDVGWIESAIREVGVTSVLADLGRANAAAPTDAAVATMLATVRGQIHNLNPTSPLAEAGYISQQLWLQAAELGEDDLAAQFSARVESERDAELVPVWTTRRVSRLLVSELGRHDGAVWALAVLPDGRVVSGSSDNRLLLWDPGEPGSTASELGRHGGPVTALAVLPDSRVVSGSTDKRVLLWDPSAPGSTPSELGRHDAAVRALAVLPDGRVVSGSTDKRVLLWEPSAPGSTPSELGGHDRVVWALAVLPDGRVVSGGGDKRVLLWDPEAPGSTPTQLGSHDRTVKAVAALPDGRVVSGSTDKRVLLWNPSVPGSKPSELGPYWSVVRGFAALPDGRVVSGGTNRRVLLWDPGRPGSPPSELGRHDSVVWALAVLPDGRVVSGGADRRVLLWDSIEPDAQTEVGRHASVALALTTLPDGRVVSGGTNRRVLLWDPGRPGSPPSELGRHDSVVWALAVLPDGRVVSGGADQRVLLWDPTKAGAPTEVGRLGSTVRALAALPDGRVASGGTDRWVLLWNPAEPGSTPTYLGYHAGAVWALAALPDGRVVSGGTDHCLLLWDPTEADSAPTLLGHHHSTVRALTVLQDGRVVSGGTDHSVLLWNPAEPGSAPRSLGHHRSSVRAVAVLPDGRVVSGGDPVLVRHLAPHSEATTVGCSAEALAAGFINRRGIASLAVAHAGGGLSFWSVAVRR